MSTDLARLRNELSPLPVQQSALTASIQIAALDGNGTLAMPASIRHVLMEIGCSDRDTLDEQMLGTQEDGFLVSFEPQLDKFAVLLARGTTRAHGQRKDRSVQLGHHHDRGIVLPLAVSPHGGPMEFHVQHVSGCSSLLRLNPRATWAPWCNTAMEVRQVPSITLASALSLVPAHLPISFLKVDAQVCHRIRCQSNATHLTCCARAPSFARVLAGCRLCTHPGHASRRAPSRSEDCARGPCVALRAALRTTTNLREGGR